MTPWRSRSDLLRIAALLGVAAVLWIAATGKWTARDWETPASYSVDALETLTRFKLSEEQGGSLLWHPSAPRLGAPGVADWSLYPLPDMAWYWLAGRASAAFGLIPASNLMLLLAHLGAALSFFVSAGFLGHRPLVAAGGALLFGFCFSISFRGLSHHSFALAFAVPPALVTVWLVGGARVLAQRPAGWIFGLGTGILVGCGNPYFFYAFGLLLVPAWLWQLATARRRATLALGVAVGVVCLAVFVATNWQFLSASRGDASAYARGASGAEVYGLRWLDLLVPPPNHHWSVAGAWGQAYGATTPGELFAPYLGVVGLAGLVLLATGGLVQLVRAGRRVRPAYLPWVAWLFAIALVGGVNTWLARAGFDYFRASNRYSIHVLAVVLFFLTSWVSRRSFRWPPLACGALVVGVTLFGLWDQIPRGPAPEHAAQLRASAEVDRALGRALESALPSGAAVFQLPVARFPEQGPIGAMSDYDLARLFLFTHSLRFSYGLLASDTLHTWQQNVARLPATEFVATLQRTGFAAVQVHKDAFADRAAALVAQLESAGATRLAESGPHIVLRLAPSGKLTPPANHDPLRFARWDEGVPRVGESSILLGPGWHAADRTPTELSRWAGQRATLQLYNASSEARHVPLQFRVTATAVTPFSLQLGSRIHLENLRAYAAQRVDVTFRLEPGLHELSLATETPARRAGPDDPRRVVFNIAELQADFAAPQH